MMHNHAKGIVIQHHSEAELTSLIDVAHLQKMQNLFADVIRTPLCMVDIHGNLITKPSREAQTCQTVRSGSLFGLDYCRSCYTAGIKQYINRQQEIYECSFGLKHLFVPIIMNEREVVGFVVIGPIHIGRRVLSTELDQDQMHSLGIDSEKLMETIRFVPLFSHKALDSINALIKDAIQYMLELGQYKQRLFEWLPSMQPAAKKSESQLMYRDLYKDRLLTVLLDLSHELTLADAGSIMIFSQQEKCLQVKLAYGIDEAYVKNYAVPVKDSIAGYVYREGKSLLLTADIAQELGIQPLLMRQRIKTALLVPLKAYNDVFGVLCLSAQEENKKFNRQTLQILDKLGELSGIAVASFSL